MRMEHRHQRRHVWVANARSRASGVVELLSVEEVGIDERGEQHSDPERAVYVSRRCRKRPIEDRRRRVAARRPIEVTDLSQTQAQGTPYSVVWAPVSQSGMVAGDAVGQHAADCFSADDAKALQRVQSAGRGVVDAARRGAFDVRVGVSRA